ncbi:hypothetical protein RvY_00264 [Ramazzottius varieornatus]|uniref:Ion transport domain-containing protein n=1 Tax=Ramazzottius varieornatus TaxID=947166 RepID=A0A1D1UM48_RAMVA|nr:hypothetical protein RvY_00264 [Ramazzottius varieornatus]
MGQQELHQIRSLYELQPPDGSASSEFESSDQSAASPYSELFRGKIYQHYMLLETSGTGGLEGGLVESPKCAPADFEDATQRRTIMREKPFAIVVSDPFPEEKQDLLFQTYGDVRVRARRRLRARISRIPATDVFARWLVENPAFQTFIMLVIAYNCVTLGIQAEYSDRSGTTAAMVRSVLDCLDVLALAIFMFEIWLKWKVNFRDFWLNPWNTFDFLITLFTFITTAISMAGNATPADTSLRSVGKTMRAFQVLRLMRILTRSQGIKVIVFTVTQSLKDMGSILVVFVLFMYIFLVTGVIFMSEMAKTTDQLVVTGNFSAEVVQYGHRFQNLYWGFLTLYQIFTIDHWYAMLHNSWCKLMDPIFPTIYILLWVLIGSLIFRNIFAGVVVNTFQSLRQTVAEEDEEDEKDISDRSLSEFKNFIDLQISEQDHHMTSQEDLLLETSESSTSLQEKPSQAQTKDPVLRLNEKGSTWLYSFLKSLHMLEKLVTLKPTKWKKDLIFQYFEVMEELQENLHERQEIVRMMDDWILTMMNKDDPASQPKPADRTKQLKTMLRNKAAHNDNEKKLPTVFGRYHGQPAAPR